MVADHPQEQTGDRPARPIRVFVYYTGVGIIQRGIESFARECFDHLRGLPGLEIELYKGAGPEAPGEHRLWCISRRHPVAALLGRMLGRTGFIVEAFTGFFFLLPHLRSRRPDVLFIPGGRPNAVLCRKARSWLGVPYRILFSNGAPEGAPFPYADHVQQLNPHLLEEGLAAGELAARQSLVPYGIHVPPGPPEDRSPGALAAARRELGLPTDRSLVLSVGWISRAHKRMDHLIEEIAGIPAEQRPYLVMLGQQDESSVPVLAMARQRLGDEGFCARTIPYAQVPAYYQAADVFVMATLGEAFGRVFLEALSAGLPCIVQDHPIHRYVLGQEGIFVDMAAPGVLSRALLAALADLPALLGAEARSRRRESVRSRFDWRVLAPAYMEMFRRCLAVDLA